MFVNKDYLIFFKIKSKIKDRLIRKKGLYMKNDADLFIKISICPSAKARRQRIVV